MGGAEEKRRNEMKDHRNLDAFTLADHLAVLVYQMTRDWPSDERFGLTAQVRRGAVSVASNIVEGCGRSTIPDYHHFLVIAHSACRELEYQLSLAERFGYVVVGAVTWSEGKTENESAVKLANRTARVLAGLIRACSELS